MEGKTVILNGKDLTLEDFIAVVRDREKVEISKESMELLKRARKVVFEMAEEGVPVYGLNRGVGWNKDKTVFKDFFQQYNKNLIYAHCVAVGPEMNEEDVRAVMLARLNTFLVGCAGIQPELALMYKEFLNHGIHPVIPERGSVGEADIANLSHVGLAMIGEGEVLYNGMRMSAKEAINKVGLEPAVLGPKDGLAIVSSNALAAGPGALAIKEISDIIDIANIIYSMSLEGLKGNVAPIGEKINKMRRFEGQNYCAEKIRSYLKGSYLWDPATTRPLQDPLSYRCASAVHGAVKDSLEYTCENLMIHLNTTEDNPCLLVDERKMITSCNFEPTTWVLGFEMLGSGLNHLSKMSCHRTIKLADPAFTGLSRFLTPAEGDTIAYGTIQKSFTSLATEINHLSNPATADFFPVAGNIEDHANNSPFVVRKTRQIVDNLRYILGIEMLHAVQAIDLRKGIKLGNGTKAIYDVVREIIPFLDKDRNLTLDIKKAYEIIKSGKLLDLVQ
ncbi:HAL/PAL/TAL family ammonia-lyase [Maledivibacter halophilus]|uniref:Histidine ammonia-lyase n=1 Tax=Maledivibacter halophilus TaxID=36842 RepID=A0A1T5M9E4_9FIRM|nr:histidine ammonia-lyase [Maledivibacter halophilus]SKC84846.1 histidine ammonia-lyase [Maledivibacter halophilus]